MCAVGRDPAHSTGDCYVTAGMMGPDATQGHGNDVTRGVLKHGGEPDEATPNEAFTPHRFAPGRRPQPAAPSLTLIWTFTSEPRPSAARRNAAMPSSKAKVALMSGFRSTLPEAMRAMALA